MALTYNNHHESLYHKISAKKDSGQDFNQTQINVLSLDVPLSSKILPSISCFMDNNNVLLGAENILIKDVIELIIQYTHEETNKPVNHGFLCASNIL